MGRKKKLETSVDEITNVSNINLARDIEFEQPIQRLELNIDLGRQDLNDVVGKLRDKINELIEKG